MSVLKIEDLSLRIHDAPILERVSMEIATGEIHGLIGESGSGKSMTALAALQLLPNGAACQGRIDLAGCDVLQASETELCHIRGRDVGMVFQEPMTALNPVQTIGAQVAETIRIHERGVTRSQARSRAEDALARAELPSDVIPPDRYPFELSGGQKQRVVIAMAIALRPKLLIADEPTTALDVTTQAQILRLLKRLAKEDGMGLMLITHDLAVVAEMADRITILQQGKIVETGDTKTILRDPKHPYTKNLLAASTHQPDREAASENVPLLQVRDVAREYPVPRKSLLHSEPPFRAVSNVTFDLHRGESLGLVGESGCGKSTLTRAILGLDPISAGDIILDGATVHTDDHAVRRKMQVVFQDPYGSFNPRHKVARLVAEPFHLSPTPPSRRAQRQAVEEALSAVDLDASDAEKYIHEFSGGQRQRIAIARALILKPDLIVLDEAVSALDVSIRAQILDLLADLSAQYGLAYLFISHDLSVVRSITDRVLVMKAGEIVEEGETETVFNAPKHPYTRSLIDAAPRLVVPERMDV